MEIMLLDEFRGTLGLYILNLYTHVEFLFSTAFVGGKRRFLLTLDVVTRVPLPEHPGIFG